VTTQVGTTAKRTGTKRTTAKRTTAKRTTTTPATAMGSASPSSTSPVSGAASTVPSTPTAAPKAPESPKPGLLLRGYRLSLTSIEKTGVLVGGTSISVLRFVGLPKGATKKLKNGQATALRGVTGWSDDVGTKVAHGVGASKTLAAQGARQGAKTWARGMKFFITLR